MPRPKNKPELLAAGSAEFERLLSLIDPLQGDKLVQPGACGDWSIKDILAHLHEWHVMMLGWYRLEMAGEKPEMPAPGYTWKMTPELNQRIYETYRDVPYSEILARLKKSHDHMMEIIGSHTDDELFTKKRYPWTGSTSMGAYFVSSTSSHYDWANKHINKFLKSLKSK